MRVTWLLVLASCAAGTTYTPQLAAPGELTLSYNAGFRMHSQGKEIAGAYGWSGLANFTRCVPRAHVSAKKAERDGALALGFSIAGGVLGGASLATIPIVATQRDSTVEALTLLAGASVAILGAVFAGLGRGYKNSANGQAIDAMNYY